ncbi:MAG: hypothetical protein QOE03_3901 [Micromonosporaceae bacterium]|nr:hypothetical protein [Micromonosporaceae bacterium]
MAEGDQVAGRGAADPGEADPAQAAGRPASDRVGEPASDADQPAPGTGVPLAGESAADGEPSPSGHPTAGAETSPGGEPTGDAELAQAVAALTDGELDRRSRSRLLGRVVREAVRERGVTSLLRPGAVVRWVLDSITEVAPHLPIRDLQTLRDHHGGLTGDALADSLVRNAARATGGIGAAGGGVAAVEWAATPMLLSAPVLLAAETVAVVAVEIKLIGELHEVYGHPVPGTGAQRAMSLLQSWANQRGVNPLAPGRGVAAALSTAARTELRDRLVKRLGRNLTTLGPMLTGAAVAGYLNQRATKSLAAELRADLLRRRIAELESSR